MTQVIIEQNKDGTYTIKLNYDYEPDVYVELENAYKELLHK